MLACTHYPLLLDLFTRLAPWPLRWIDPAPAIARRADHVLSAQFPAAPRPQGAAPAEKFAFRFTSGAAPSPRLMDFALGNATPPALRKKRPGAAES